MIKRVKLKTISAYLKWDASNCVIESTMLNPATYDFSFNNKRRIIIVKDINLSLSSRGQTGEILKSSTIMEI